MKRFASVLVRRRRIILALTLLCCCISLVLIPQVEINTDMTKYLPDDSSMQQGMDIMEVEFPDTELAKTIRVMFQGLEEEQIPEILATLESIEYVDSVAYEADSTDYNREDYTLFVVSTEYDYGSPQERAIEAALEEDFSAFDMVYKNDSTNTMDLPAWVVVLALTVLMIILFFMCSSWAEPFLFMLNIGIAIAINMGTNRILGSISTVTFSIAAILQLVLSMDYSVILMNRYRQEREHTADRPGGHGDRPAQRLLLGGQQRHDHGGGPADAGVHAVPDRHGPGHRASQGRAHHHDLHLHLPAGADSALRRPDHEDRQEGPAHPHRGAGGFQLPPPPGAGGCVCSPFYWVLLSEKRHRHRLHPGGQRPHRGYLPHGELPCAGI